MSNDHLQDDSEVDRLERHLDDANQEIARLKESLVFWKREYGLADGAIKCAAQEITQLQEENEFHCNTFGKGWDEMKAEITRLKDENARLKAERDELKTTLAEEILYLKTKRIKGGENER